MLVSKIIPKTIGVMSDGREKTGLPMLEELPLVATP